MEPIRLWVQLWPMSVCVQVACCGGLLRTQVRDVGAWVHTEHRWASHAIIAKAKVWKVRDVGAWVHSGHRWGIAGNQSQGLYMCKCVLWGPGCTLITDGHHKQL